MKIVIGTQHKENYGAHDWDGKGECPQYWKFKGGNTYIIEDVSVEQAQDPAFWDAAEKAVSSSSDYFEEYVIYQELMDDCDSPNMDPWETPIMIGPSFEPNTWCALQTEVNGKYGYMAPEVAKKYTAWKIVDGEEQDYKCSLEFTNGKILPWAEACEYLSELREAA